MRRAGGQSGVVSVIAVLLLAMVVMLMLIMSIQVANTGINDTLNQSASVAALFLAESGVENATARLGSGSAACDASLADTISGIGQGGFSVQAGATTDYDEVTPLAAGQCRFQVTGTVSASAVARTVEAIVEVGGGGAGLSLDNADSRDRNNQDTLSWNFTTAGTERLLLVGVSLRRDAGQVVNLVSYDGVALTFVGAQNNDPDVRVELWYLLAPSLGSNSLDITMSAASRFVAGAASFNGVDQTTPLELPASFASGDSFFPSVSVTTATDNAWVVDVYGALSNSGQLMWGRTALWNEPSPGNPRIQGASSYVGPVSPPGSEIMWWISASPPWAMGTVALRPSSGASRLLSWREVIL